MIFKLIYVVCAHSLQEFCNIGATAAFVVVVIVMYSFRGTGEEISWQSFV